MNKENMSREVEILKRNRLKITSKRQIILSILFESEEPLTAEEIYEKMKKDMNVSFSTIYRALSIFEDKDIVRKDLAVNGESAYQINDHSHTHRIVCRRCGASVTIEVCPLEEETRRLQRETGYKITGHSLEFTGICPKCGG